jgi:predicted DNA repair protein MutK
MAISLAAIPESTFFIEAGALALVGIGVTVGVYGVVGLIIKMDDVGLHLAGRDNRAVQLVGKGLVRGMPRLLTFLSVVGTAAMLWVGGSIVIHGLHELGMHHPYQEIHHLAVAAGAKVPVVTGFFEWLVTATCDGILGLLYGLLLIPLATRVVVPAWQKIRPSTPVPK